MSVVPRGWDRVKAVFQSALARTPEERPTFLSEVCGEDAVLRHEVESLLAAHQQAGTFAERPAAAGDASALEPNSMFGPYRITSKIGAGGMGEVYRAHDTALGRDVALKVLPRDVADDPDRLARMEREARVLAALNHPHIATIHGVEQSGGTRALVLELVEGPTLADRLSSGPLRLEEALRVAAQIAEALAAAHDKGIIHRDLKPANVKLTLEGNVKVLDFGLAKSTSVPGSWSQAPGLSYPTTAEGVLAGTPAYMSPEQARGQGVDKRTDIWALACVLFEMLVGRAAFPGETMTDVLAHVIERDPDWALLPAGAPPSIRRLLRRCLDKEPSRRFHDARDIRLEIEDSLRDAPEPRQRREGALRPLWALSAVAAMTALVVGVGAWLLTRTSPAPPRLVARTVLAVEPFDQRPAAAPGETRQPATLPSRTGIALSRDGRMLVFGGTRDSNQDWQLYLRPLDRLGVVPLPGTEGAVNPFFSPDGSSVGFWANGEIRRVALAGGPPSVVTRVPGTGARNIDGASWEDGDVILFSTLDTLWSVPASGGQPTDVARRGAGEYALKFPRFLPGHQAVLFTRQKTAYRWNDAEIIVLSLSTGEQTVLVADGADAHYVSSGHLVFARRGTLMAAPFDLERLLVAGGPVALFDDVMQAVNIGNLQADTGAAQFAVSTEGRLVYVTGGIAPDAERALVWVDRNGTVEPLSAPRREYSSARLSPDGRGVVVNTRPSASGEGDRVWILDVSRGTLAPLTGQDEAAGGGLWSPDGARIVYSATVAGRPSLFSKRADGAGRSESFGAGTSPSSWSRDGRIAFIQGGVGRANDVWVVDVNAADRRAQPVLDAPGSQHHPAFSPDGKWLAYTSNETGREEVYVQSYPGPGLRVLVSTAGGMAPAWRGDGAEIFYATFKAGTDTVMMNAVPVGATASTFSAGAPRTLFEGRYNMTIGARSYDVTHDGRRFLMVQSWDAPPRPARHMVLVENWFEELRARVPNR